MPSLDNCCVPGCSNRREKCSDLSFHPLPAQEDRRKRWVVAVRRDEEEDFRITDNTVVCGEHFTLDSYHSPALAFTTQPGSRVSRRLKNDAVPTVFAFSKKPIYSRPPLCSARKMHKSARTSVSASWSLRSFRDMDLFKKWIL